jgi:hypothetical protein
MRGASGPPTLAEMAAPLAHPPTARAEARSRADRLPLARPSQLSDGAVIERLARMRAACQALALELAGARRELKTVQAELRRVKQRHGED